MGKNFLLEKELSWSETVLKLGLGWSRLEVCGIVDFVAFKII